MTTIYFVRHAQPDYLNHDDMSRELTPQGMEDRKKVTTFLKDKNVNVVLSSPYKRAMDTVRDFANSANLPVISVPDFRERKMDSGWTEDFDSFCRQQWADFDYKLSDGETLRQVQIRNIAALEKVLDEYAGKVVVVGGHGTAISTVMNYYDPGFGYESFERIRNRMPWVVRMDFDDHECLKIEECI